MQDDRGVDEASGRKFFLDSPDDTERGELTFLLNLHGGGSAGAWQREYFPAYELADRYGLVIASPSAATTEPTSHWTADADDDYLQRVVSIVFERFGLDRIRAFWLVGHSQGGMTSMRLLSTPFFAERVDGWLSLSGGRIGRAPIVEDFGPPRTEEQSAAMAEYFARRRREAPPLPDTDFSFIFSTGEHEIVSLPETSPWAEKYGAGPRVRLDDVIDETPGKVYDTRWEGRFKKSWGREARPGVAQVYVYPGTRDGRIVADVVRCDKGHTEGLEPKVTEELVKLIVAAPGGKARSLA